MEPSSPSDTATDAPSEGTTLEGREPPQQGRAGLVLLYAREFEQFQAAYAFDRNDIVIGRDASADIVIPEHAVSRRHARIAFDGQRWTLVDLGSRNGTMVDGSFVRTDVELEDLQEIRVGDALFKFVARDADQYVPYRIDGSVLRERKAPHMPALVGGWQIDCIAEQLQRVASARTPCVLLGETGTGKNLAAHEIHRVSGRAGPLQTIHCSIIPHSLIESELFGYLPDANSTDRYKPGLVQLADAGTLFVDEIGDMPLESQSRLLRLLQTRELLALGATSGPLVDVKVVCTTHRDLRRLVADGRFRGDLFEHLSRYRIWMPALRERKEDLFQLARLFASRYGKRDYGFHFSFVVGLFHHDWPYNVRELEECMKRATALAHGDVIDAGQLPESIASAMRGYGGQPTQPHRVLSRETRAPTAVAFAPSSLPSRRAPPTELELRDLLARYHGNVAAVGRELGKERMQVHRWMKRYGISVEDYRDQR